jgi:beta-glucosidase
MSELRIPRDFEMGVATSSWQIEGDVAGRGRSTWDDFAEVPGAIVDGTTGEPACDHVHRLTEDLELLHWLGADAYRFSCSWPRVQPGGVGPISPSGLGFYDRLVDGLLERGIKPVVTLFHWDLPSELEALGGWTNRDTAYRFADYVAVMADRFADRIDRWATLNEPWCPAFLGYSAGYFAPGHTSGHEAFSAAYHLMLGHGLAVQQLRLASARNVGIVLNLQPFYAEDTEGQAAATHIDAIHNRFFLNLLTNQGVPAVLMENCVDVTDWSFVQAGDADVIAAPLDWIGENYYSVGRLRGAGDVTATAVGQDLRAYPGCPSATFAPRSPVTEMGWEIFPPGLTETLRMIADTLPRVPIWICENGAATVEDVTDDGVHDPDRIAYLQAHLTELMRARERGIDVRGYFAWSLLDNIEWASGWTKRFGLIRVDEQTGQRIAKDSAHWYQNQLRNREAP